MKRNKSNKFMRNRSALLRLCFFPLFSLYAAAAAAAALRRQHDLLSAPPMKQKCNIPFSVEKMFPSSFLSLNNAELGSSDHT